MSGPVTEPPLSRRQGLLRSDMARSVSSNVVARLLAVLGLTVSTIVVARTGGASAVGAYALLRVIPGLVGVLAVAGLPGALAYFLSAARRDRTALWPTIVTILVAGSVLGSAGWLALTPVMATAFFPDDSTMIVAAAGLTVATQLFLTVGKTSLQGLEDRRGGDFVIAAEEIAFLPFFVGALALGLDGTAAVLVGLALADVVVGIDAWRRVARGMGWQRYGAMSAGRGWIGRPDLRLGREICSYGLRGQVGGVVLLLNLRLDFAILGAIAGPAVLGTYAIASKYAELLKLPGVALTWVTYPRLARAGEAETSRSARRLLVPALLAVALAGIPLFVLAGPVLVLLYGNEFDAAVRPAHILVAGLVLAGASGVASGYLYGRGRPGLNSGALSVGLAITVVLDLLLIPRHGAVGAAIASTAAYLVTDVILIAMLIKLSGRRLSGQSNPRRVVEAVP